ncbi:enterochelin esterase domain-containing protein [Microbacterium indicum]|uniref:enterochelin esterase domain-containing protein n=1 Tax=Microbacterium indicum TaxID=358100 RepID=UPI00146A0970|nr:enterochelin esterase domain-containing protein [Microbacterium indicum]
MPPVKSSPLRQRPAAASPHLLTIPPQTPRPERVRRGGSPLVGAAGDPRGARELWEHARRVGTPLVEGSGPTRAFTWVWRGEATRVALVAGKLADDEAQGDVMFERIAGSDVWALTLELGAGWRATYSLAVADGSGVAPPALAERRARALAATDPDRHASVGAWYDLLAGARPDPLARESFRGSSVASGPEAPPRPSADGEPLRAAGPSESGTWVHPDAPTPDGGWRPLVLLDGDRLRDDEGLLRACLRRDTAALLLGHGDMASRDRELACSPETVDGIVAMLDAAPVQTADGPATIAGSSLGGLTAIYAQALHPDRFGASVSQSGSFWWPNARSGASAEWLTDAIERADARFDRVHLSVGLDEWVLLDPTERLRLALAPRTAALTADAFDGGHDAACWAAALPAILDGVRRS